MTPSCGPASCPAGNFASCSANAGCECDLDAVPDLRSLNREDFITGTTCTSDKIEVRLNKCILNKAGLKLNELYLNGPDLDLDSLDSLGSSSDNNCRGQLSYENGPEYVFTISKNLADCKTKIEGNKYTNAVQGFVIDSDDKTTEKRKFLIDFTCDL